MCGRQHYKGKSVLLDMSRPFSAMSIFEMSKCVQDYLDFHGLWLSKERILYTTSSEDYTRKYSWTVDAFVNGANKAEVCNLIPQKLTLHYKLDGVAHTKICDDLKDLPDLMDALRKNLIPKQQDLRDISKQLREMTGLLREIAPR